MPYAFLNGFRLFFDVRGCGEVVAFIHGGFPSLDVHLRALALDADLRAQEVGDWDWEMDFVDRFRFLMYDRRGCWRSSRPDEGYEISNQALDLARLLDDLEIDAAHVIGSSAGGPIAVWFAATYPERTGALVLAGTGADLFPAEDTVTPILRSQLRVLETEGAEAAWKNRPEGVEISLDVLWEREEMKERGTLELYESGLRSQLETASRFPEFERIEWHATQLRAMRAYVDADIKQRCGRVRAPTLVVHGDRDKIVPVAWGEELASMISGAKLRVYRDVSHGPVHRSEAVRQDVMKFLRAHS